MSLNWISTPIAEHAPHALHRSECAADSAQTLQAAIEDMVEKTAEFLNTSMTDNSLFLQFAWQDQQLSSVVTDASKTQDSPTQVICTFTQLPEMSSEELAEEVQYQLHDYLSTCKGFLQYSLIAQFHTGDRHRAALL